MFGQVRVENDAADGGLDELTLHLDWHSVWHVLIVVGGGQIDYFTGVAQADRGEQFHFAGFQREDDFISSTEDAAFTLGSGLGLGEVVDSQHHVLRRHGERQTVRRRKNVARAEHEHRSFHLRFRRKRNVHSHLVAVKVRVERGADERMDADSFTFDEHRLEGLNAEAVKRRSAVEHHGMFANHVFENVPDDGILLLDHFLGLLNGGAVTLGFELVIDEGLEKLERHLLWQTALVKLQFRADDDYGTARVIDALAEKVLAEAALLALERVGQGLERAIVGATQNTATTAVVEQSVNSFLKHALFVTHDYVGRAQLHELLQAVVAVDYATIQIVEIGRGEAAAVQRNERAQLRRKDRDHVKNHPLWLVAALAECFEHFEALGELDALLQRRISLHLFAQLVGKLFHFDTAQKFLDGFGAHLGVELAGIFFLEFAIFIFEKYFSLTKNGDLAWINDYERFKVQDAFEVTHGNVQQVADTAGQAFEKPDVRARRSELDVSKTLAANLAQGDFHAALVADHSAMLHALIFSAQAFPVGDGAKNFGAEKAVPFGFEGAVIDGLRFGNFAVRP